MITLTTIEGLQQVAPGSTIRVRTSGGAVRDAVRTEGGFTMSGATLPTEFFSGAVAAGRVSLPPMWEVGDVYTHNHNGFYYRVVGAPTTEDDRVYFLQSDTGGRVSCAWYPPNRVPDGLTRVATLESTHPVSVAYQVGQNWAESARSALTATAGSSEVLQARLRVSERNSRAAALEDFREKLMEEWDGTSFTESEINAVLEHFDLGPIVEREVEVEVTVDVTGTTYLDNDDIERLVQAHRAVDISEGVSVSWSWSFTHMVTVDEGVCACEHVDSEIVSDALSNEGINYDDFDYECDCENG